MSKPYFAYENLVPEATISARTESSVYPASNLTKHRLWPGCRSADKSLNLNGTDEYAYVADHADFDLTTSCTIEILFKTPSTLSGFHRLLHKADASTGYGVVQTGAALRFYVNQSANYVQSVQSLETDTYYRAKLIFDNGAITIFLNGVDVTGATTGTIPSSLSTNSLNLGIGATSTGGSPFEGEIAHVGIDKTPRDNGGYLDPVVCEGYWSFDDSTNRLADSSGNGHTLTGVNIYAENYQDCTSHQWIRFNWVSPQFPRYCFIDRRHNLSTGATVNLLATFLFNNYSVLASATATAGEPIVLETPSGGGQNWYLEIHDPGNPDGYIEIPYVYLGTKTELSRGFLRGFHHGKRRHGNVIADSVGGFTGYARSERLWEADLRLRALPADLATVRSLSAVAGLGRPFVCSEDGSAARTRLVYWPDAIAPAYSHNVDTQHFVDLPLREAGGGL